MKSLLYATHCALCGVPLGDRSPTSRCRDCLTIRKPFPQLDPPTVQGIGEATVFVVIALAAIVVFWVLRSL